MKISIGLSISRKSLCLPMVIVATAIIVTTEALSVAPLKGINGVNVPRPSDLAPLSAFRKEGGDRMGYENGGLQRPPFATKNVERKADLLLSAVAVGTSDSATATLSAEEEQSDQAEALVEQEQTSSLDFAAVQSVITTALLVTGNTVGAGALALPELSARPGLAISTGMFGAAYLVNLLSGLILAEVAIKQHEARGEESPSSFRAFAAMSLDSPTVANLIAGVSLFVNFCALTYSLGRAGCILSDVSGGVDHSVLSVAFAAGLVLMGATQSRVKISQFSSFFVAALFASLAGLLVPGLPNVQDPMGTFLAPGTSDSISTGMAEAAPIMLTTLIFQNIVPPVTRILNYDRTKSVLALMIGSFLPLAIYLAWSFVVLGGGVDTNVGLESPLMTMFSVAAVTGSSIGCTMAISEELQAFGAGEDSSTTEQNTEAVVVSESIRSANSIAETQDSSMIESSTDSGYSLQAVLVAVTIPLGCSALCHEYTDALKLSGGYGIPVLYGAIPIVMAWTQRKKFEGHANLVPGGKASLGVVGGAFGLFMINSIMGDIAHLASSV